MHRLDLDVSSLLVGLEKSRNDVSAGVRLESHRPLGWSVLVEAVVEEAWLAPDPDPLLHHRGRWRRPG